MKNLTNIFLIGFMGCGKSTVATKLNQMYGMQIIEMDQAIVEKQKMSIPEIFEKYGEPYFRDLESELLGDIQENKWQVISCGGGVPLREKNVALMQRRGHVVWLTAKPETILKRVLENDDRPLLSGKKSVEYITQLMSDRQEKYKNAADILIETDDKNIQEICKEIMDKLGGETLC